MKSAWKSGNVVELPLPNGRLGYGIVVKIPLIAFMDLHAQVRPGLDEILQRPVLFKIWVVEKALGGAGWPVIGHVDLPTSLQTAPAFYKFDTVSKKFQIYESGKDRSATREHCVDIEAAAVWSASHVISRLDDHFHGRTNCWVEGLRAVNRH